MVTGNSENDLRYFHEIPVFVFLLSQSFLFLLLLDILLFTLKFLLFVPWDR